MTRAAPGVLRRRRSEGMLLTAPLGSIQRHPRDKGGFVIDAVFDAFTEASERKHLVERSRRRGR